MNHEGISKAKKFKCARRVLKSEQWPESGSGIGSFHAHNFKPGMLTMKDLRQFSLSPIFPSLCSTRSIFMHRRKHDRLSSLAHSWLAKTLPLGDTCHGNSCSKESLVAKIRTRSYSCSQGAQLDLYLPTMVTLISVGAMARAIF